MNRQVIKNRIRKILAYTFTGLLFLLISAFLVLQIPPVQNYLISNYLKDFTKATGFPTTVGSFSMLWFDRLELLDVKIFDPEGHKMISADKILINFKLSNLIESNDINIDGIFVDSAHVYLTKINSADTVRELNINAFIARINENFSSGGGGGGKPPRINIGEAFVNQSQFTYINQDADSVRGFDYNHFSLAVDEGQLRSFVVLGDTIEFDVRTLLAEDLKTKFGIKHLATFFRMSQQSMEFIGLDLKAGQSEISDTVIFTFDHQRDLNEFVSKVKIHANLKNTLIDPRDLALFAPGVERIDQPIRVSGIAKGRVNKFKFSKMDLQFGSTRLTGSLDMDGLPEINETFINLNVRHSKLNPDDLSFILEENVLKRLRPMGTLEMNGQFLGYPSDFVANGSFNGKLGAIRSDINFKVNEQNFDRSTYSGKISLSEFDLGRYLNDTLFYQKVNLDGKVSGAGLTQSTADFQLTGHVSSIGLYGYNYVNIDTDARFASGLFRGLAEIDDPNLQMRARGSIDLRDGRNQIRIRAQLDTANLHPLHLAREPVFVQASLIADISGLTLDSLKGTAYVNGLQIGYRDEWLKLDRIAIDAQHDTRNRSFKVESSVADIEVKGNFHYSEISRDIQILTKEVILNIKNDKSDIDHYYLQKKYRPKSYSANLAINIKDIHPITDLLDIDLDMSKNTTIEGRFTSGTTTILNAYTHFDSLKYNGMRFAENEADITISKVSDSTSVLAMATVVSQSQFVNKDLKTKNLLTEAIWNNQHIDFSFDADQEGHSNSVRLKGAVDFMNDSTIITMAPSALKLLQRDWMFGPGNYVSVQGKRWHFHELALTNAEQSVSVNGEISKDPDKILSLELKQLDLSLLDVLSPNKFKGIANARIDLKSLYSDPIVLNDILVKDLTVNDFLVGDVQGVNKWDTLQRKFDIDLFVDRNGNRIVNLDGTYDPMNKNALDIIAKLDRAELRLLDPFLKDIFSRLDGTVSGNFKIAGPLNAPLIDGEGVVTKGQLMINYLKTMYRVNGIVGLTPNSIYFKDIELTDGSKNKAKLNGNITHENFHKMFVNLKADFKTFQVLNTTVKDNNLFYGQAHASGDVSFYGPVDNLKISSNARTEKGTRVYIPIGGGSSVEKKDFITFVNFSDTVTTKTIQTDLKKKINLTGLTFDLNLDVTPDAYCEIIFDLKAGDIIRGRGNGDIKLQLDTKGEFNMFGPFEFTEGWYNFTLYDIVNKEFHIQKGSRLSWYGDPYQGIMNINASYNQQASLAPLIADNTAATLPQVKRKYPVRVDLQLEGQMLSPQIKFDIFADDLPQNIPNENGSPVNLDLTFTVFKNKLDEQELYRQVFSLIVLQRFSPPDAFDASGSVGNSVSELLSNQLSRWMSQVDENLEFDFDLGSFDENSFNTFQLRVAYTFLQGRLRVTGDQTYAANNNTPANVNQKTPSSFAGDWTVDYILTPDGKLRVKMYSRTSNNTVLGTVNNQSTLTTGASIIHTQSFNELRDLWKSSREKKNKKAQQTKQEEEKKDEEETVAPNKEAVKEEEEGGRE